MTFAPAIVLAAGLAVGSIASVDVAFAAGKPQPTNAGKDGQKSNAGGGNGGEFLSLTSTNTAPEVVGTPTTYNQTSDEVVDTQVINAPPDETIITKTPLTDPVRVGSSDNYKQKFLVVEETRHYEGSELITTYNVYEITVTTKQDVTTTVYSDIDPGRSQEVNQAPEEETYTDVTTGPTYLVTTKSVEPVDTEDVKTGQITHTDSLVSSTEKTVTCEQGHGGLGGNYCGSGQSADDLELPDGPGNNN